jgi:hypothetical protein
MSAQKIAAGCDRIVLLADVEKPLQQRADGIDSWLREAGNSCKVDQKHLDEGTVERAYWHYGYMVALRDVLDRLRRQSQALS